MRLLAAAIMGAAAAATPEPSVAVAVVACGRLAGEALFGMCVRSLRGPGAFAGAIYALTDRPACAPATTTVAAVRAERDGLFGLECRRRAAKPSRPPAQVPVRVEHAVDARLHGAREHRADAALEVLLELLLGRHLRGRGHGRCVHGSQILEYFYPILRIQFSSPPIRAKTSYDQKPSEQLSNILQT